MKLGNSNTRKQTAVVLRTFALSVLILGLSTFAFGAKFKDGEELVAAMHRKYDGKWYKTLTFEQKTTQYKPDGSSTVAIWYEAMSVPGKLRIDFDPVSEKSGVMFSDGQQFSFKDGKLVNKGALLHPLMVLGFDVYGQPVSDTIAQLKQLKFDLSKIREDRWQGRSVYVVGADKDDMKTAQFWIDKKRLLFVRMLRGVGPKGAILSETQFNKYKKVKGGGWIAPEVIFINDGKRSVLEEYTDIKAGMEFREGMFDPEKW
ncbi:MAG: hypothetical protein R2684_13115 [Pyrinomonadaceae bacterium]